MERLLHREAALVGDLSGIADDFIRAMVCAFEHYLDGVRANLGHVEDVGNGHADPLGVAHDAVPGDLLHDRTGLLGPVLGNGAVAAALECGLVSSVGQVLDLVESEREVGCDLAVNDEPV